MNTDKFIDVEIYLKFSFILLSVTAKNSEYYGEIVMKQLW